MKFKITVVFLFLCHVIIAQIFSEYPLKDSFVGVERSSIAFADVDGDNDEDILVTGLNFNDPVSKLYLNDGFGNFTEKVGTPLVNLADSAIAFSDVDMDGDQDVLLTGRDSAFNGRSILYLNDGLGNFTEKLDTPFEAAYESAIAFADVDGDNDEDVFITGIGDGLSDIESKLYINDGLGNFTEKLGTSFIGVRNGSVAFADLNGDGDLDFLLTGDSQVFDPITIRYNNDGQGNFSPSSSNVFEAIFRSSVAIADVDGDNDLDVMISGTRENFNPTTRLYINDGLGNFTQDQDNSFSGLTHSTISFADIDGDNYQDILLTGQTSSSVPRTRLYLNNGQGFFTEDSDIPFSNISYGSVDFSDIDGDGDQDLMYSGLPLGGPITHLYFNDGQGNFLESLDYPFFRTGSDGSIDFSDVDGDGDQDLFLSSTLYLNDGQANFREKMDTPFTEVGLSSIGFLDIDGDGDEDLFGIGYAFSDEVSKLYRNDGLGNFTEVLNTPFEAINSSSIAFADVDGDSDEDIFITGQGSFGPIAKLYLNDGLGNFTEMLNTPFVGVKQGSVAFADVDGDQNPDILITGIIDLSSNRISKLYINDGQGNFTEKPNTPFEPVGLSSIAFSDVDSDGDMDVLITGSSSNIGIIAKLYVNDGLGNFTENPDTPFYSASKGSVAFFDVDGDQDPDLLITGYFQVNTGRSTLYVNDGLGNFTEVLNTPFEGVENSAVAIADVDGDQNLDVFIAGEVTNFVTISKLYLNQLPLIISDVSGFSYFDANENQTKDPDERTLINQVIQITPNPTFSYATTIDGQYHFSVATGAHELSAIPSENWRLTSDSIINIDFIGQSLTNINFGFIPTAIIPLVDPDISSGPTRCGFDVPFWLSYQNNGTTFENGFIELSLDEGTIPEVVLPQPDLVIGNKMKWNFTNLAPSEIENIRLILKMPDASNIGDTLDFVATTYLIDDNQDTTQNSVYHYNPVLNCAYDPNDKAALPAGVGEDNLTLFDSDFEYRIRFQNTGTDTAFTVRIEDDLDPNLDWNTFRPVSASHPYEVDMDLTSGRVTFLFRNILLPDSIVNEPLSHGFVKYKISPLENLSEETPITNEASIFFDFNEPILTNMTLNTMVSVLTNTTEVLQSTELTVLPNPFHNSTIFRIKELPENRGTLNIYDTNGVLVFSQSVVSNADVTFRKEGLASRVYFYEVVSDQNVRVFGGKVVKY